MPQPPLERYVPDPDGVRPEREFDLARILNWVLEQPLLRGRVIEETLAIGSNSVDHGMGRIPQGFVATGEAAGMDVYNEGDHTVSHLFVNAAAAGKCWLIIW